MGIFDAIHVAESALSVHRFRSEIAAENVANIHTPGYRRQEVDLRANSFKSTLEGIGNAGQAHGANSIGGSMPQTARSTSPACEPSAAASTTSARRRSWRRPT